MSTDVGNNYYVWTRARFTQTTSVYLCPVNPPDANWHFRCGTEVRKASLQGVVNPIMFTRILQTRSEPFERKMGVMFRMVRRHALNRRLSWSITAQEDQNTRVTYSWIDHGNWQSTYSICNSPEERKANLPGIVVVCSGHSRCCP
jgi:hypothetical protein